MCCRLIGGKPFAVKLCGKMTRGMRSLEYFTTHQVWQIIHYKFKFKLSVELEQWKYGSPEQQLRSKGQVLLWRDWTNYSYFWTQGDILLSLRGPRLGSVHPGLRHGDSFKLPQIIADFNMLPFIGHEKICLEAVSWNTTCLQVRSFSQLVNLNFSLKCKMSENLTIFS